MKARTGSTGTPLPKLSFSYDETGDILHIDTVQPYAAQDSDELTTHLVVRRNPRTGAVENLEVLSFGYLLLSSAPSARSLADLFTLPAPGSKD